VVQGNPCPIYLGECREAISKLGGDLKMEQAWLMYVGSYGEEHEDGIYVYEMNKTTGELKRLQSIKGIANASFQCIDKNQQLLYSVSEVDDGLVATYQINSETGLLTESGKLKTESSISCHLSVTKDRRYLFVANYQGGVVTRFELDTDGIPKRILNSIQHEGGSTHPTRQEGPHPHSVNIDPTGSIVLVPDLGNDTIYSYRLENGAFDEIRKLRLPDGAGPRHLTFNAAGSICYIINELDSTITVCDYDLESSELTIKQHISTLPENYQGESTCADIHMSLDGRFVYGSNRGHDSIAVYRVQESTGKLELNGFIETRGQTPRNFALSPDGRFILAENQESDTIVVMPLDQESGLAGEPVWIESISKPICITFLER